MRHKLRHTGWTVAAACGGILAHPSPIHLLSSRHCAYSPVDTRLGGCAVLSGGVTGRGRPEAARRAGLEFVEKLLTTKLTSTSTTERNAGMLRLAPRPVIVVELVARSGLSSPWPWLPSPSAGLVPARRPRPRRWIGRTGTPLATLAERQGHETNHFRYGQAPNRQRATEEATSPTPWRSR